jgi:uncharacterized protein with HEPN domain
MTPATDEELLRLLSDIVHWGDRVSSHVAGLTAEAFSTDASKCDAVCWCIACLGEAAGKVRQMRPRFAAEHPAIELSKAYAMRNRIAHGYSELDVGVLWQAATVSVPALLSAVRTAIDASQS